LFRAPSLPFTDVIRQIEDLPAGQRPKLQCVTGHIPYGLHRYLAHQYQYVTLLRDPVERVISHYYYIVAKPHHRIARQIYDQELTLEEYASSYLAPDLRNGQVRMLCGLENMDGINGQEPASELGLDAAKRNLCSTGMAFGLSERFDESVLALSRAIGWTNVFYTKKHVNQNRPTRSELPRPAIRAIEENNALDLELYDFAKKKFEEFLREYEVSQRTLSTFRIKNRCYGILHPWGTTRPENDGLLKPHNRLLNRFKRDIKTRIKKLGV
jgi:hypothetical protein